MKNLSGLQKPENKSNHKGHMDMVRKMEIRKFYSQVMSCKPVTINNVKPTQCFTVANDSNTLKIK